MITEIVSAGIGLGGAIYGGIKAGQERKRMENYLTTQESGNEAQFNKDYYADYTNRADTQALMKKMRDNLKQENKITNQTAVVTGATPEAVNVQKDQNNKVVTNTMSNVAASGQQWKDRVQDRYLNMKNNYAQMRYGNMAASAASYENLMGNGIAAMGSSVAGLSNNLMTPKQPVQGIDTGVDIVNGMHKNANKIGQEALKTFK